MKPHPPPTTQFAYWLYLASSLYNFLKSGPPPYNGDELKVFRPNAVLTSRPIQYSWTLYTHEYTTLPAAGPVDVTEPQPEFPHWSRDVTVPPTLFHLAVAVSLLDKLQPEYIVPDRQCFWYTAMLYHLLVGQDALGAEVEHDAKRVAIGAAHCSEASRGTSIFASDTTFRAHPGTFRDLFQRVTHKDIEELRTEEELDAIACEVRLVKLYSSLRDAMLDDRKRFGSWGPFAVPGKDAMIDALRETITDMEVEVVEATSRKTLEAERVKAAAEREVWRAKAAEELEAAKAAMAKKMEEERALAIKELEAQRAATAKEFEEEIAASTRALEAAKGAASRETGTERATAKERAEAAAAKDRQLAALEEEHAAALARLAELERWAASGGAGPSKAAQVQ
ncbi:uncharacterized protein TRAVEDRAFT_75346 [Trametes versicolor FP-101664 SS1]|uniref:uncharacterized protein n=1 Tax=Trametes versicolor (strain FP-101664) TaxID=717944 RepID=UPI00046239FA|nr:uncharacterized protein TRAVEDRAFT_75346 [Trametes versicolor FP-101664 SS1]EIW52354.1 hypothetical protein TRAVEDRAFT_75346 [Trametes versicolor FP-101664 SS1]